MSVVFFSGEISSHKNKSGKGHFDTRDGGVHPRKKRQMMMMVVVVFFSRFCRCRKRRSQMMMTRGYYIERRQRQNPFWNLFFFPRERFCSLVFSLPILKIHLHPILLEHHAARRSTQKNTTTKLRKRRRPRRTMFNKFIPIVTSRSHR